MLEHYFIQVLAPLYLYVFFELAIKFFKQIF